MITLTLLHPIQSVPVQSWPFDTESVIRIGRSTDNDVVLYSAVVSRHHVEIRRNNSDWEVVSLGANGTYIDGKQIDRSPVVDGIIIRLASSGPKIQIRISSDSGGKQKDEKEKRRKSQEREQTRDTFINS
ncbi:MAG: FHA domain-containing protein [Spirulinaceae cyanobacterium]